MAAISARGQEGFDRRVLLRKGVIGAGAAGALWVAPSVLTLSSAHAAGSCVYSTSLDWDNLNGGSIGAPSTAATVNGFANIPQVGPYGPNRINMSVVRVGTPGGPGTAPNGIQNITLGALPGSHYCIAMTNNAANEGYRMDFTFRNAANTANVSVYNLSFTILDVDQSGTTLNGFQDIITITPAPSSFTKANPPFITGTNPFQGVSGTNVDPAISDGNLTITFTGPVSSFSIQFTSGNRLNAQQAIGITDLTWCY